MKGVLLVMPSVYCNVLLNYIPAVLQELMASLFLLRLQLLADQLWVLNIQRCAPPVRQFRWDTEFISSFRLENERFFLCWAGSVFNPPLCWIIMYHCFTLWNGPNCWHTFHQHIAGNNVHSDEYTLHLPVSHTPEVGLLGVLNDFIPPDPCFEL